MNWFKREKPIVVNCYTWDKDVYKYAPIQPSKNFYPNWYKNFMQQKKHNKEDTIETDISHCVGFKNLYKRGFVIPMWSELLLSVGEINNPSVDWQYADLKSNLSFHEFKQVGNWLSENDIQHCKLIPPWKIECKQDVDFFWSEMTWNTSIDTMKVLPAIVDYKHQNTTNINLLIRRTHERQNIKIDFNQPMAHIVPLSERKLVIKNHLISKQKWEEELSDTPKFFFQAEYHKTKKLCPIHNK